MFYKTSSPGNNNNNSKRAGRGYILNPQPDNRWFTPTSAGSQKNYFMTRVPPPTTGNSLREVSSSAVTDNHVNCNGNDSGAVSSYRLELDNNGGNLPAADRVQSAESLWKRVRDSTRNTPSRQPLETVVSNNITTVNNTRQKAAVARNSFPLTTTSAQNNDQETHGNQNAMNNKGLPPGALNNRLKLQTNSGENLNGRESLEGFNHSGPPPPVTNSAATQPSKSGHWPALVRLRNEIAKTSSSVHKNYSSENANLQQQDSMECSSRLGASEPGPGFPDSGFSASVNSSPSSNSRASQEQEQVGAKIEMNGRLTPSLLTSGGIPQKSSSWLGLIGKNGLSNMSVNHSSPKSNGSCVKETDCLGQVQQQQQQQQPLQNWDSTIASRLADLPLTWRQLKATLVGCLLSFSLNKSIF